MDYLISDTTLDNIATAIREKTGKQDKMTLVQMPDEIRGISGAEPEPPDDGKTRLYITIPNSINRSIPILFDTIYLLFGNVSGESISVDWGDNSELENMVLESALNSYISSHKYKNPGDYVITVYPYNGTIINFGSGASGVPAIFATSEYFSSNNLYDYLKRVYIGENVKKIMPYAFIGCSCLYYMAISEGIDTIENNSLPAKMSIIGVSFPSTVTEIKENALLYSGIKELHFKSNTPPEIQSNSLPPINDVIIYVPVGSLEAYKTATNWSVYASRIQEEPV